MYFILLAEKKSWRMLERNILGANVFFRVFDCGLFRLGSRFGGGWHGVSCSASLRPELRALGDNFCSIFFLPSVFVFPNPVGCDRKRANFHSGGQRAEFRIASQVPYNDCFV